METLECKFFTEVALGPWCRWPQIRNRYR